jgi:tetratricopeptide (TPR) repeat protein
MGGDENDTPELETHTTNANAKESYGETPAPVVDPETARKVIERWQTAKQNNDDAMKAQYNSTRLARQLYHGHLYMHPLVSTAVIDKGDSDIIRNSNRVITEVNMFRPIINAIKGTIIKHKKNVYYWSMTENTPQEKIDDLNALRETIRRRAKADTVEKKQDLDMLINGYGAVFVDLDYVNDPKGAIIYERIDPLMVGWDMGARDANLTDTEFAYFWKRYSKESAEQIFGSTDGMEQGTLQNDDYVESGTSRQTQTDYGTSMNDPRASHYDVYNFQYYEYEKYAPVANPLLTTNDPQAQALIAQVLDKHLKDENIDYAQSPETIDMSLDNIHEINEDLALAGMSLQVVGDVYSKKCFYTAILSGDKVFKHYKSLYQKGFSIQFKTCDFDDHKEFWYGYTRILEVTAIQLSKVITESIRVMARNGTSQTYIEESAFTNNIPNQMSEKHAVIKVPNGAITGNRILQKDISIANTGYENLIVFFMDMVSKITGVSPAYLGDTQDVNETGILNQRRVKQTLVALADVLDMVADYGKNDAELLLSHLKELIKTNPKAAIFIRQGDQKQVVSMQSTDLQDEYTAMVDEVATTEELREYAFESFKEMGAALIQQGNIDRALPLFDKAIEMMPLPPKDKQALRESMQKPTIDPEMVAKLQQENEQLKAQLADNTQTTIKAMALEKTANANLKVAQTHKTELESQQLGQEIDERTVVSEAHARTAKLIADTKIEGTDGQN